VKRRQELRGKYNKSIVIDDFAHHPTSMELTIDCIREKYPNKKCFVVFEPVTSTARSNAFQKKFSQVFNHADYVLIANPQINTNAKQYNNLDYDQLAKDITSEGTEAKAVKELPELIKSIDQLSQEDSILLVCSNRTVLGLWKSEFVNKIE
jgi:UDP-N-acetylmuramate-alanine ligase